MNKFDAISAILSRESALTVNLINSLVNLQDWQRKSNEESWSNYYFGSLSTGVKNRLAKAFNKIGIEFTVPALRALSESEKKVIATEHELRCQKIADEVRRKALKYCLAHKDLVEKWLFDGYRLHVQQWSGSNRHKRLVGTAEGTLFDNIRAAFKGISVQEGNDAPRGGSAGQFYVYAGTALEAEGWYADMLMI